MTNVRWLAPELLEENGKTSFRSDVWSFGMLCLETMTGTHPFPDWSETTVIIRVNQGETPDRPDPEAAHPMLRNELWSLMEECWSWKPDDRPEMREICKRLERLLSKAGCKQYTIREHTDSLILWHSGLDESPQLFSSH